MIPALLAPMLLVVPPEGTAPEFTAAGGPFQLVGTIEAGPAAVGAPPPQAACYANCDGSVAPPLLNAADFTCFLERYQSGDPYANCDGSTGAPLLSVADFSCFLARFAAGCP